MDEREDLVLLHGFAGTRRTWDGVLTHLPAERYRPLALDLPGHGESAAHAGPIDFDACIASVLERSPERFVLCGYSMGGRIALRLALEHPGRVSRLVLVAASPGIEDENERERRRRADRALANEIENGPIEQFVGRWCAQPLFARDPAAVDALAREDYGRNDPAALAAVLRGVGQGEMVPLWDRLGELEMPVAALVGDRDAKLRAIAEKMVASLPSARVLVVPGGHRLPLESSMQVVQAID